MFKKTIVLFFILFICQNLASAQEDIALLRQMIFEKTNDLRVEKGLSKLLLLDSLMRLAQHHSDNMLKHTFYSHTDHEGLNPIMRAKKMGINPWVKKGNQYVGISENIAMTPWFENITGCGDTRSEEAFSSCLVQGWKNSPPHYKNILGDFTFLGIGLSFDGEGKGYSTQNFR